MPPLQELEALVRAVVTRCLDVRAVWSIGNDEVLVFADRPTLLRLRECDDLRRPEIDVLVVTDADAFETVWGKRRLSGSLARWAWRQVSADLAYFDESLWAGKEGHPGDDVVRVRRKATLLWQSGSALA